jgi:hypothetical protein
LDILEFKVSVSDYKLIQVFLSQSSTNPGPGIFEVSGDDEQNLRCTCPGFSVKGTCKHTKYVALAIVENDGVYPIEVSTKASLAETELARQDPDKFREFLLKYGKIKVF